MKTRVLRQQIFLGSTTEEVNQKVDAFLEEKNICIGNYADIFAHHKIYNRDQGRAAEGVVV